MVRASQILAAAAVVTSTPVLADSVGEANDPLAKVVQMLSGLQAKIIKEGEHVHSEYAEYAEWCEDTSKELHHEIKTGEGNVADLKASITKESATVEELTEKIGELSSKAAKAEAELKEATKVRKTEAANAAAQDKELTATLAATKRALKVLSQGGASLAQFTRAKDVAHVLSAMVQASALETADASRLASLVQRSSSTDDDDSERSEGGKTDAVVDMLEGIQDKAEEQLESCRKAETDAARAFQLLKQSLENEATVAATEIEEAKNNIAASKEVKGLAEGELDKAAKDFSADQNSLSDVHANCQRSAEDYEEGVKARDEELAALAQAKKAIMDVVGGGSFEQVSFLQVVSGQGKPHAAVRFLLELARKQNSRSLAQLAHRLSSTIKIKAARGQDPFTKVKGLIEDMIAKLEKDAGADATHQAYCDKETKETKAKEDDKSKEIDKLNTAIDETSSRLAVLQEEVSGLTTELAKIAESQKEYDELFAKQQETFASAQAEMQKGIQGVQLAIKVLKDYYSKNDSSSGGAAGGIIGLLETVESDFDKSLSEAKSNFEGQQQAHKQTTMENQMISLAKNQDAKYKKIEMTELQDKLKSDTSDRKGVQTELDAVNKYMSGIAASCTETAEPYEEIKARRDAEIAGLREGLQVLDGASAASLLQADRSARRAKFLEPDA